MPRLWLFPLFLLFALAVGPARGAASDPRHFDAAAVGGRVDLGKQWLFAPDGRPTYAGLHFDDSGWRVVSTDRSLLTYGYQNLPYCCYRLHARLLPDAHKLALLVSSTAGAYEVYANGVRFGGVGNMAHHSMQQQAGILA